MRNKEERDNEDPVLKTRPLEEETWSDNPHDIINFEPDNYIELGELPPPYMPN